MSIDNVADFATLSAYYCRKNNFWGGFYYIETDSAKWMVSSRMLLPISLLGAAALGGDAVCRESVWGRTTARFFSIGVGR